MIGCPACMLALFADAPSFEKLINEARASPTGKICACADCKGALGADSAKRGHYARKSSILSSVVGFEGSEDSGPVGQSGSTTDGSTVADSGNGTGIDLSQIAALAGSVDPAKIAAFLATVAGKGGSSQVAPPPPPPAPIQNKNADETHIWVIALVVLVVLTIFVLSQKSNQKKK